MRGPNKVKRKGLSNDKSRRTSVASVSSVSSASTEDSRTSSNGSGSPPPTEPQQLTMTLDANAFSKKSSKLTSSTDSASMETPRVERPRPSHIDLTGTGLYDRMLPPTAIPDPRPFGYDPDPSDPNFNAIRRASLPSYLLESFSNYHINRSPSLGHVYTPPRGLDVVNTTTSRYVQHNAR